ncbi:hypothetical protein Tco_0366775 [Tanacetum coccineum]
MECGTATTRIFLNYSRIVYAEFRAKNIKGVCLSKKRSDPSDDLLKWNSTLDFYEFVDSVAEIGQDAHSPLLEEFTAPWFDKKSSSLVETLKSLDEEPSNIVTTKDVVEDLRILKGVDYGQAKGVAGGDGVEAVKVLGRMVAGGNNRGDMGGMVFGGYGVWLQGLKDKYGEEAILVPQLSLFFHLV